MTGFPRNGVGLAGVLGDIGVNKVDNVRTNRGFHDMGQGKTSTVGGHIGLQGLDGNEGAGGGGHF